MCQSIQIIYKFCGCEGEFYQQTCPNPSATCKLLLHSPTTLKLTCYCEIHSSQTFKTVHQDQRDTARVNKEYNKILAREEQQRQKAPTRGGQTERPLTPTPDANHARRERSQTAQEREQQLFLADRKKSICEKQIEVAEFRQREREMEAYGRRWGKFALRRKYPIAKARAEDQKRRKRQEKAIAKRGAEIQRYGVGGESSAGCCVM
jgi:hypothetical protein